MSVPQIIWLGLSSLIFALWAYLMFRTLFRLLRGALANAAKRGAAWPNAREQLGQFATFATAPEYRRTRWQLFGLTVALLSVQLTGQTLWPLGG